MFKKKELPKVEPVTIKPLFGMKPGLWLTIAYALAIVLLIFLVGILPDLIGSSRRVSFTSAAYNSAVYIDGTYAGGTPFVRKVPSGKHSISFQVNGHEIDSMEITVKKGVFFNWLFPRKQTVESTKALTKEAFDSVCAELLQDACDYSAILDYDYKRPYANIFTNYAKTVLASSYKDNTEAFEAALFFVTTEEMASDADNAIALLGLDIENPYRALDGKSIGIDNSENPVLEAKKTSLKTDFFTLEGFEIPKATFSNGRATTASYPEVKEAGKQVTTEAFNIASYCVTEYQYAQFVLQNPQWSVENKSKLVEEGLVDEYYLDGVTLSTKVVSLKPVRNISYYAAQAFCTWLGQVSGRSVYLPTENQWIAASLTDTEGGFQKSLTPSEATSFPEAMLGGVWEMTGTAYVPLSRLDGSSEVYKVLEKYSTKADTVVKGGSYVNDKNSIDAYSTGIAYKSLCSDYMGFRIAWN